MNMMNQYLGEAYSENHIINFCLYWLKGREDTRKGDKWRLNNDLDCLYLKDLRAETLMSTWIWIKWVAEYINKPKKFYKTSKYGDPNFYLNLLANNCDKYLHPDHELVNLLNRFCELAEGRWNMILLPERKMNNERYNGTGNGKLYDEVPSTLYHIYLKESLGKYFLGKDGEVDCELVEKWIRREYLEMGFEDGLIRQDKIIPLIEGHDLFQPKVLTDERDIRTALEYQIQFLEMRKAAMGFTEI